MIASRIVKGRPLTEQGIRRLLLIQSGDIGDVVLSTPCITSLRDRFPRVSLTVAVRRKARQLMDDCPLIDHVLVVDEMKGSARRRITSALQQAFYWRRARFDLAIDLRTGSRGAIMARVSGAPRRVSFYADNEAFWRNRLFTHLAKIPYTKGTYVADYYHLLLETFLVTSRTGPLQLWINPERQRRVDRICLEKGIDPLKPFIALQPFSLWQYKELPEEHYIQLIGTIHSRFQVPVAVIGGPAEKDRALRLCNGLDRAAVSLAGETSIGELCALLARSCLMVGIDSSGLHIAAAVGCPTIGIFGPSASASWAPRGLDHLAIQATEPCSACRDKGCHGSGVSLCLQRLPVAPILEAIEKQLQFQSCTFTNRSAQPNA
jgi:heptosyltransferase-3